MTRIPGSFLLKVARFIFDESVLATVVTPTISDLQQELREAGDDRAQRIRAALRGYAAFWVLVIASPVAFHKLSTRSIGSQEMADRNPGIAFALIVASIVLCAWNFLGWWTIVAAAGGACFASLIHWWHNRHPTVLVVPEKGVWRAPEINQSRIPVDGNIAGLMYVVGSLVVALIGIPIARWFFFSTVALGLICAVALLAWHNAHPRRLTSIRVA
jgi:hypothetical protein